jgi:hypothetical protein
MKKTTLLIIGALAFVLQATAQTTIYSEDFESQATGATPQNWVGGNLWVWSGASATTWDVESPLDSTGDFNTQAAVVTFANAAGWAGFSSGDQLTWIPGDNNSLATMHFSMDLSIGGTAGAGGTQPLAIWFVQKSGAGIGGGQVWAGEYDPVMVTDGSWNHVSFALSDLTIQTTNPGYNSGDPVNWGADMQKPFIFSIDTGISGLSSAGGTSIVSEDNFLLVAANPIPEPGTIALLTLGGLGALVVIRRRVA